MLAAAERHLSGLATWSVPSHGMFLWLDLAPSGVTDTQELIQGRAVDARVLLVPGAAFACDPSAPSTKVRAAYSLASAEDIDEGLRRLSALLRGEK